MITRPALNTQLDAVVHFFSKMDVEMVSTLLDAQISYQDYSKSMFIRKLGDLFFEFTQLGDNHLLLEKGECYGCSCGFSGYTFIGNESLSYIDIVFVSDSEGKISDIYECGEFFNKRAKIKKKNRLYLDKYVDFDFDEDEDDLWDESDPFCGDDDIPF